MYIEGKIKLGNYNHPIKKVEVEIVGHRLSNSDGKKVADLDIQIGEFKVTFAIIEGSKYLYAINPFLTQMDNGFEIANLDIVGLGKYQSRELLRNLNAIAVDYHKIQMLEYQHQDYDKVGNRKCSNCRFTAMAEFDIKDLGKSRRMYCKMKSIILDEENKAVKEVLNSVDGNDWFMKNKGLITSNPEWGVESSKQRMLEDMIGTKEVGCRMHHYSFKNSDGEWYNQKSYSGHFPWDFKSQEIELPNAVVNFKLSDSLATLYSFYQTVYENGNQVDLSQFPSFIELEDKDFNDVVAGLAKLGNIDEDILAGAINSYQRPTVEDSSPDISETRARFLRLCEEAGVAIEDNGSTTLDFLLRESEEFIKATLEDKTLLPGIAEDTREALKETILKLAS